MKSRFEARLGVQRIPASLLEGLVLHNPSQFLLAQVTLTAKLALNQGFVVVTILRLIRVRKSMRNRSLFSILGKGTLGKSGYQALKKSSAQTFLSGTILVAATGLSGCYMTPDFGPPGTIGMQRSRAVVHDPFPDNDIAPPIMGGRPLGFDRPMAEAEKNQSDFRSGGARVVPYQGM